MTYSFLQKIFRRPFAPEMAVDLLQCFPQSASNAGKNRLQVSNSNLRELAALVSASGGSALFR